MVTDIIEVIVVRASISSSSCSAAYYACPDRGIEAVAMDQIAAKVSGMSECRYTSIYGR